MLYVLVVKEWCNSLLLVMLSLVVGNELHLQNLHLINNSVSSEHCEILVLSQAIRAVFSCFELSTCP